MIVASIRSTTDDNDVLIACCVDCLIKIFVAVEEYKAQRDDINALINSPVNSLIRFGQ